jgi:putative methyltransferase (TIGR04325 family)
MLGRAQLVRELTPPLVWNYSKRRLPGLVRALGGHFTHIRFTGDYATFEEARRNSRGYDAPQILAKTREAILLVKEGRHRWERDAMISDTLEQPWTLLACLLRVAASEGRRALSVLDFGGSLGSTYYWVRPFLSPTVQLRWTVVEQPGHVAVGRAEFQNEELRFAETMSEALTIARPDVLLISGVVHFLKDPEAFLTQLGDWRVPYFIFDREPLWRHDHHRLTIQHVPAEIYEATYPAWFLSRQRILSVIARCYDTIWEAPDSEAWEIDDESVPNSTWFFKLRGSPNPQTESITASPTDRLT